MGKYYLILLYIAFLLAFSVQVFAEDDHGNSCASATPIDYHYLQIDGIIEIGSDYDFFRIDIEKEMGRWSFNASGSLAYLCLMDSDCSVIECCDSPGCYISQALYSGTYYISVRSNGTDTGSYTLYITPEPAGILGWFVGTITDAHSGLPIKGAKIITDIGKSAISLADGRYLIIHTAGTFNITAEATRYNSVTFENIEIQEAEVKTVDFELIPLPTNPLSYLPLLLDDD